MDVLQSVTASNRNPISGLASYGAAFFDAAVEAGAEVLHEPRLWPEYHDQYHGAFVRDPDGNDLEAVCHLADPA